jgi:PiT family inorganic phosphate transporter
MLALLIALALLYAFLNGYRDSSSILAGVIASRAMHPNLALYLVAIAEFVAPFLFGVAVARAVATGLIVPEGISLSTILVAMGAALGWTLIAWWRGIPSSSSHALIGGLLGAALILNGPQSILASGLVKIVLPLFLAPPLGMVVGYLSMHVLLWAFRNAAPKVNVLFRRLQILTMILLALSHSANDAQKSMGIIALGLVLAGKIASFYVPPGVVIACASAIALGASRGDWRLIRTLGGKIFRVRPLNALASQAASTGVVMVSALAGTPVSTSQVISMALMGSGAAEQVRKVRWQVGVEMLTTWALTIPATMVMATAIVFLFTQLTKLGWLVSWFISWLSSS